MSFKLHDPRDRAGPEADRSSAASGRGPVAALSDALRPWPPEARHGLAVSGGRDSMALLCAAAERAEASRRFLVIHVDHGLRPESADEAEFVVAATKRMGLESRVLRPRVQHDGGGLEERARRARYGAFAGVAAELRLATVLTAHHRDDQRETVALALWRGSFVTQMKGMPCHRPLAAGLATVLVRPFLTLAPAELTAFLEARAESWREDASNRDLRHRRNRLRHVLLPALHAGEAESEQRLDLLRRRADALDARIERLVACIDEAREATARLTRRGEIGSDIDAVVLDCERLARVPVELARRLIERAARRGGHVAASFALRRSTARALLALADGQAVDLAPSLRGRRRGEGLLLEPHAAGSAPAACALVLPGRTVHGAMRYETRLGLAPSDARSVPQRQWIALAALAGTPRLRSAAPGERFRPFGFDGSRAVRDALAEAGAGDRRRRARTVLADDRGVLWIPGVRADARCRVAPGEPAFEIVACDRTPA